MFGDFMIGTIFEEYTISEITLALLEDLGWYKINKYTGGLFRYGKNQGCKFLNENCVQNDKAINTNDFCDIKGALKCYSSRMARGYCYQSEYAEDLPVQWRYYTKKNYGGFQDADFCPITQNYNEDYEVSTCNRGTKQYNNDYIGDSSFCFMNSLGNGEDFLPTCNKITCDFDNRKYTVKYGSATIACPKEGGVISSVSGYKGKFYCPEFNLVCTSRQVCNGVFECIEKKALPYENTNNYDYEMNNNMPESPYRTNPGNNTGGKALSIWEKFYSYIYAGSSFIAAAIIIISIIVVCVKKGKCACCSNCCSCCKKKEQTNTYAYNDYQRESAGNLQTYNNNKNYAGVQSVYAVNTNLRTGNYNYIQGQNGEVFYTYNYGNY